MAENFNINPILAHDPKELAEYKYQNMTYSIVGLAKSLMYGGYIAEQARSRNGSVQSAMEEDMRRYPYTRRDTFKVGMIPLYVRNKCYSKNVPSHFLGSLFLYD